MRMSASARLMIESGILVSLVAGAGWLAVLGYKVEAHGFKQQELEQNQRVLSKELVDTQLKMIEDLTAIKTHMGIKEK